MLRVSQDDTIVGHMAPSITSLLTEQDELSGPAPSVIAISLQDMSIPPPPLPGRPYRGAMFVPNGECIRNTFERSDAPFPSP